MSRRKQTRWYASVSDDPERTLCYFMIGRAREDLVTHVRYVARKVAKYGADMARWKRNNTDWRVERAAESAHEWLQGDSGSLTLETCTDALNMDAKKVSEAILDPYYEALADAWDTECPHEAQINLEPLQEALGL